MATATAALQERAARFVWTQDQACDAAWKWFRLYGVPPTALDWNPGALERRGLVDRLERWNQGDYPTCYQVKTLFGNLSECLYKAGLMPRSIQAHHYGRAILTAVSNRDQLVPIIDRHYAPTDL